MTAIVTETVGDVFVVTVNRPEARNAINAVVSEGIAEAIDLLDRSPDLRVGILTGADGHFSSGMDLKEFVSAPPTAPLRGFAGLTSTTPAKPLIAAVEGYALAGGMELVLECDLLVASTDATFGIPEVRRGLIAGGGGLLRLPRRVPYHLAMEWALTGRNVSAVRAYEVGLVNRLSPPGRALAVALELAMEIVANAPLAVQASKQVLQYAAEWPGEIAFDKQAPYVEAIVASEDALEGARAFAERREPKWRGN